MNRAYYKNNYYNVEESKIDLKTCTLNKLLENCKKTVGLRINDNKTKCKIITGKLTIMQNLRVGKYLFE